MLHFVEPIAQSYDNLMFTSTVLSEFGVLNNAD